ncbi:YfjI family protein, partial [Sphingobium yanoikuyae]
QYVYQSALLPVPEVAITAALGLMAGICGKVWVIPKSGLNLYIVLVARSGIGKEAMHDGISDLITAALPFCPVAGNFADFTEYASGPALIKACVHNQCFVNVSGEIGHRFRAMADNKDPAMRTLRTQMTNLYTKSAPNSVSGGISYSNQDNNVEAVKGGAFSVLGETTPGTFYESLTPAMMEDGFMSRFCVIEYRGDRPDRNRAQIAHPPEKLVRQLAALMTHSDLSLAAGNNQMVTFSTGAAELLDAFYERCADGVRAAGDDEAKRQVWNRANLKALRVAALLAVGDNMSNPIVTVEQAQWAIGLIEYGNSTFLDRINAGEVGEGTDGGRESKVIGVCREFITPGAKMPKGLKNGEEMGKNGIVPRLYLQTRTQRVAAFEKHKLGAKAALDLAINTAIANGKLMEVKKDKLVEIYDFHGRAFRVLNLN